MKITVAFGIRYLQFLWSLRGVKISRKQAEKEWNEMTDGEKFLTKIMFENAKNQLKNKKEK